MRAGQAGLTAANSTPTLSATWRPHGQGDRHSTGRHTGTPPRPVSCPSPPPGDAFPCTLAPQDRPPPPSTPASSSPAQPLPPPCRLLRCCLHPNSLGRLWEAPPPTDCWLHPVGSSRSSSSKGAWTGASPRSRQLPTAAREHRSAEHAVSRTAAWPWPPRHGSRPPPWAGQLAQAPLLLPSSHAVPQENR